MRRSAGAVAVVLVAAACSGSGAKPSASPTPSPGATVLPLANTASGSDETQALWRRSDLRAVSQPASGSSYAVLYALVGKQLTVQALDPGTGKTLWSSNASAGSITPGTVPALSVIDGRVAVPGLDGLKHVIFGIEVSTGRSVWVSAPATFFDWPTTCPDDATSFCTETDDGVARIEASGTGDAEVATGQTRQQVLAPDLADTGTGTLAHTAPTWTASLATLFGSAQASTDTGWDILRDSRAGLYVGSVSRGTGTTSGATSAPTVVDLTASSSAGFTVGAGKSLWVDRGSTTLCSQALLPTGDDPLQPYVRCRGTGTVTYVPGQPVTYSAGLRLSVEGFDRRTGKALWSHPLGDPRAAFPDASSSPPPRLSATAIVEPGTDAKTQLDLATGVVATVADGAGAWCQVAQQLDPSSGVTTTLGLGWQPCDGHGVTTAVPATAPAWVGTTAQGVEVWSGPEGVTAARLAQP